MEYEDSGSEFCDGECRGRGDSLLVGGYRADRLDLSEIFFSNEEYYSKLEELKKAHLRTMAELESLYRRKLQLQTAECLDTAALEAGHRPLWSSGSPVPSRRLRKSLSAVELRRLSAQYDSSDEEEAANNDVEKGLLFSPKEHIKNMWRDFQVPSLARRLSSSSLDGRRPRGKGRPGDGRRESEPWRHRITVPKPFHMMLREDERRRRGIKTRSEVELENAELRRRLEELTECQRKFRASPVPAHVHLPLYEELQERQEERQRRVRVRGDRQHPGTVPKPFSFLERERLKKEQKEQQRRRRPEEAAARREAVRPFKAKPVPRSVYEAASGEHAREEQLYRSIKIQMRARELLHSASMPPSMSARRQEDEKKKKTKEDEGGSGDGFTHSPQINREVPDFEASYRRFLRHLEKHKEVKPTTSCEPFELRTSHIASHHERVMADIEKERASPRAALRWPHIGPAAAARTPNSSLCSSLSGSLELLPSKDTDATKKRHEAVRKALEQRKKAEEEEERWREKQRQREKKLQRVVSKRAQANDPHLALSQTHQSKLREFRKQEQQRTKEYQQEIKEMHRRVKGRPLLLEQVAQRNAKQAAEKHYADALRRCDLSETFISGKAAKSRSFRETSPSVDSSQSNHEDPDAEYESVSYKKVYLDDDEDAEEVDQDQDGRSTETSANQQDGEDQHCSDDSYRYSEDHESYSEDSEHDDTTNPEKGGE